MIEGIYQTLSMALAIVAFYVIDFLLIAYYAKQRNSSSWEFGYTFVAIVVAMVICLQPILLPVLSLHIAAFWGRWVQLGGLILVAGSLLLQLWSRSHLKWFYAERADLQPGHYVVETGPYANVRHPLFVSYFVFVLGLVCITPGIMTLAILVYTWWDFTKEAEADERLLSRNVPGYVEYMKRVPRFIPQWGTIFEGYDRSH